MTSYNPSLCYACERYARGSCEAYPERIPDAILVGGADHRSPLPGDHGKQFLMADRPDADLALQEWILAFG